MGKLLTQDQLTPDVSWHFTNAYWSSDKGRWMARHPDPSWPAMCAIHDDNFERSSYNPTPDLKQEIRRWIEASLPDNVLLDYKELDYQYYRGEYKGWDSCWSMQNRYRLFYFESNESALLFKLRFSEVIVPVTYNHPKKHEPDMKRSDADRFERTGIDPNSPYDFSKR